MEQIDADIVPMLVAGETQAIEAVYERYARLAYGLAYRMLNDQMAAEDVVQEAFVALWRHATLFDPGRGHIRNWLLTIVRNRAIDRLRSRPQHREWRNLDDANLAIGGRWDDVDRIQVRKLLDDLPASQRQTLELAYFGGYTHSEIAKRMAVPLGTVKGRLRGGLQKMANALNSTSPS